MRYFGEKRRTEIETEDRIGVHLIHISGAYYARKLKFARIYTVVLHVCRYNVLNEIINLLAEGVSNLGFQN